MADVFQTTEARQEAARIKLKQHDDAIRANGIKAGYAKRDEEWKQRLGVSSMEEATEIGHLRSELKRRITPEEERKHGSAKFWAGMFTGAMCAAAVSAVGVAIVVNMVIGPTFDAAARSRFDQMAVEAITQERPPTTDEPRSESAP